MGPTSLEVVGASRLLSLADSRTEARALRCWSTAQMATVCESVKVLMCEWYADWCINVSANPPLIEDASEVLFKVQALKRADAQAGLDLINQKASVDAFRQTLLGESLWGDQIADLESANARRNDVPHKEPDLAAELCAQAWVSLQQRLQQLAGKTIGQGSLESSNEWSGILHLGIDWAGRHWRLQLDAAAVASVLAAQVRGGAQTTPAGVDSFPNDNLKRGESDAALIPMAQAMREQSVQVRVELERVTLSLGQLQDLVLGDVIPLPHSLSCPANVYLNVKGAELAAPICTAWLGQSQGRMGVELQPHSEASF